MAAVIPFHRLALQLLFAALLLVPTLAEAQIEMKEPPPDRDSTVYFSIRGGWAIMHDVEFSRFSTFYTYEPDAEAAFDSGWTGSGSIGYRSNRPWRVEFEASQWSNTFDQIQWNRYYKFGNFPTSGKIDTQAYMINAIGEIPDEDGHRMFAGVGVGFAKFDLQNVSDVDGKLFDEKDTSFALQFIVGVDLMMTENLAFSVAYKLFGSTLDINADANQPGIGGDRVRMPLAVSSILLGLTYDF